VVLAPSPTGTEAPALVLPGGGRVAVEAGLAHVAVTEDGTTFVSLDAGASVCCCDADRCRAPGAPRAVGPGTFVAARSGLVPAPAGSAAGRAAASAFRDLAFFGGAPAAGSTGRATSALFWRVVRAPDAAGRAVAPARASDADGVPAIRVDLEASPERATVARVAWRPDAPSRAADALTVSLAARAARSGPGGDGPVPDAPLPRLVVTAETADGRVLAEASVEAGPEMGAAAGPRATAPLRVTLALPPDWLERVGEDEIVVAMRAERAPAVAWFRSAHFHRSADPPRDDAAARGSADPKE
jgi:hypothetical protein